MDVSEKTESVQLYVSEETKRELRIAAAENETSMAEYVRNMLLRELEER